VRFEDKVVLVTGAAGAIGNGIAERFCELGASVFLTDLDRAGLDRRCEGLSAKGGRCKALAADFPREIMAASALRAGLTSPGRRSPRLIVQSIFFIRFDSMIAGIIPALFPISFGVSLLIKLPAKFMSVIYFSLRSISVIKNGIPSRRLRFFLIFNGTPR